MENFEEDCIEIVLEDWDNIVEKAAMNEEFKHSEVVSLLWVKALLELQLE